MMKRLRRVENRRARDPVRTKQLDPFIANMHMALWVLAGVSLLGAAVSLMRPAHVIGDVTLDEIFEAEAA